MRLFTETNYNRNRVVTDVFSSLITASVFSLTLKVFIYGSNTPECALFGFMLFVVLLILTRNFNLTPGGFLLATGLGAAAFILRMFMLDFKSGDYNSFLSKWVQFFRDNGGFKALGKQIGDYNFPYLYFLAFFSYMTIDDLILIKFLSIAADILLALYAMKLTAHFTGNKLKHFAVFFIILLLPTVCLNSAKWAQCDSIYTAFALISVYYALKNRPLLAVSFAAVSFSFKLQAVFILPVFAVFLISKHIKLRHLIMFVVTYVFIVLPAIIAGRPPLDALTIYVNQTGSYSSYLTLNAPSIFSFLSKTPENSLPYSIAGVLLAVTAICCVLYKAHNLYKNKRLSDAYILLSACFFTVVIPFLLPSMHERYFFPADILSVICVFTLPVNALLPIMVQFGSYIGYDAYLNGYYRADIRLGGLMMAVSTVYLGNLLFRTVEK